MLKDTQIRYVEIFIYTHKYLYGSKRISVIVMLMGGKNGKCSKSPTTEEMAKSIVVHAFIGTLANL